MELMSDRCTSHLQLTIKSLMPTVHWRQSFYFMRMGRSAVLWELELEREWEGVEENKFSFALCLYFILLVSLPFSFFLALAIPLPTFFYHTIYSTISKGTLQFSQIYCRTVSIFITISLERQFSVCHCYCRSMSIEHILSVRSPCIDW